MANNRTKSIRFAGDLADRLDAYTAKKSEEDGIALTTNGLINGLCKQFLKKEARNKKG